MKIIEYWLIGLVFVLLGILALLLGLDISSNWLNKKVIELSLLVLVFLLMIALIIINYINHEITEKNKQASEGINTAINANHTLASRVSEKEIELSKKYHLAETYLQEVLHPIACSSGYTEMNKENKHLDLHKREVLAEAGKTLASILKIEIPRIDADHTEKTPVEQQEEEIKKLNTQLDQLEDCEEKIKLTNELNVLENQQKELKMKQAQKLLAGLKIRQKQVEKELADQLKEFEYQLKELQ